MSSHLIPDASVTRLLTATVAQQENRSKSFVANQHRSKENSEMAEFALKN